MSHTILRTKDDITDIYNKYVNTVYRICRIFLKNIMETEDATQTVFVKLINTHKEFESDKHLKAWLIVTAQNTCKDILKGSWMSKRADLESIDSWNTYLADDSKIDLWDKVMSLPPKYKLPLYLYYYEGYSTFEIAKILNLNHATLRTHIRKARLILKLLIEEEN